MVFFADVRTTVLEVLRGDIPLYVYVCVYLSDNPHQKACGQPEVKHAEKNPVCASNNASSDISATIESQELNVCARTHPNIPKH